MENNYGSVITEQGDLGLGVMPINENSSNKDKKDNEEGKSNKK